MDIFNAEQKKKGRAVLRYNKLAPLSDLYSSEIQDLGIVWAYYSGKIEGNTYTLIETEILLKDGITSLKSYNEAKMLKNLYNTFISQLEYIRGDRRKVEIDKRLLFTYHAALIQDLVDNKDRGSIRKMPIRITGTPYVPPKNKFEIERGLDSIMENQEGIENPLEKAVYLHCSLAKLQPFIDGNKRTARLIESVALMNEDIIPIYSTEPQDIIDYRKSLIHFYETGDYSLYADYFLGKKIDHLQSLTTENILGGLSQNRSQGRQG